VPTEEDVCAIRKRRLFEFPARFSRRTFTLPQAAEASGLSVVSVKTYVSKKLEGRWVEATDDQHYKVHGLLRISSREFERAMSQKADSAFGGLGSWRAQLRNLLQLGIEHGYPVATVVSDVLNDLGASLPSPRSGGAHKTHQSRAL
jgi:hypothetical protein